MKILVTGATGKLGSKVVEELLKTVPAEQIAVSVRNPEKAEGLKASGVEVRQGDFDKPETLDAAFSGIDRLLIISSSEVRLGGDEIRRSNTPMQLQQLNVPTLNLLRLPVHLMQATVTFSLLQFIKLQKKQL
ncbi:uncharacterized protein YbjT (DUF2867 family) [Neobacillus niacini]|nr:uncharacterized protein YbjT (DUF2867 family) [Neobacillus niacini]